MKYLTIPKNGNNAGLEIDEALEEINLIDSFIALDEKELARYINLKLLSLITTWKVKLTKIYLTSKSLSSYDLEGIDDKILRQQILIEAITKDDIISHKELTSNFKIVNNVIYVPKEKKERTSHIIKVPQEKKVGWDEEDFLAIYYAKDENFYGYTCFEGPTVNNPIERSLPKLAKMSKIISFMLNYYFFHNVAPYLDSQTKVYNKNYLNKLLNVFDKGFSDIYLLINIDVNNLKNINDEFGHLKGDEVIKYVASTLRDCVRENEKIIRWGGDEFLIIVNEISVDNAARLIRRIEYSLNEKKAPFKFFKGISLGYALGKVSSAEDFEKLYNLSDLMLYSNKKKKNAVYNFNAVGQ